MGKSTLGNYLIDPDEKHMLDNPNFCPAQDNKPRTQEIKIVTKKVQIDDDRNEMLTIIDTPALDESAVKKLHRAIDIIKKLNECREIRACVLVVKFSATIYAQYKATLEYYSKLLPGLFDSNLIIVMTDYATDERSEIMRKRQHIDIEQVKRNTIEELRKCSNNQTYSPQLFTIDCLALERDEMETSLAVRRAILDCILQLPPIEVKNQTIAKTDCIKHKDAEKYQKLQGEIAAYSERLKEVRKNSKKVLDDIHKKQKEITEIENKITKERCEAELEAFQKLNKEKLAEIELLETYIDERRRAAEKYHSDLTVMTIEEAMARLDELQKH